MSVAIFLQMIGIGFICFLLGYYFAYKKQNDEMERKMDMFEETEQEREELHERCVSKEWLQARISSIYNEIRGINKKMKTNEISPVTTNVIDKELNSLIP